MENKMMIPFVVHEADMERLERTNKRLWILSILLVFLLVGTNIGWIWYESQFEEVVETTTQEVDQDVETGDGDTTVIGIGDIYGEGETEGSNN